MKRLLNKMGITDFTSFYTVAKQLVKFGIVGVGNTFISLAVYYILVHLSVNYIIASIVGFVISVCNAYFWNSRYVFVRKEEQAARPLIRSFAVYGSTFLLSTGLLYLLVDVFDISQFAAPVICLCITIPANFLLNKHWAFK